MDKVRALRGARQGEGSRTRAGGGSASRGRNGHAEADKETAREGERVEDSAWEVEERPEEGVRWREGWRWP